ncbi:UDP-N-acetylmuramoyl-tripeptide--D-alanyl-D-alanine ligase [Aquibacillus sp. 3ASR75-11]|uniref:UDP-N-acetylmuramoyl-tripeptide--D-alanyl-D-alanine ligase n=2 Tax=Terrihalobacillus insolitus TaxID=2950438 RepID=A0A9X3WS70_9BACI|nr:UDP-N-acetylmuramoyl-tripeptide--D-alanyl-D-alanine ligase [Terrihalobacillus insolitus]MDC3412831.1 UDP-N-acetylmuramoyl-tripeptide--D-alanyl-D-alanine ligase [Terrihalobacillus insolitus]MDC3423693.1 UDP-N-acetylmuramoyl-tripeptide--D-alanyl-D-alanine ligase [Terrihalobacillus insolitus]
MLFSTREIEELFPEHQGAVHDSISISEVVTDSRKQSRKSLFVPLIGESFDGHSFIKQAFNNGAVACLWQKDKDIPAFLPTDFPVFLVDDPLVALQRLSYWYRKKVNPIVIGITGSNGKTTTKDLVAGVLESQYKVHKTQGNLNNHIGLPLTILSMDGTTEILVLEMGMSHFGEIEQLSLIAEPDYGVITNIGESHIEYLGSREGIAQAKSEILAGMSKNGFLLLDGDEALLKPLHRKEKVISCGFSSSNTIVVHDVFMTTEATTFSINGEERYELKLLGKHHAKNATYAITLGNLLNVPLDKIKQALRTLSLSGMRFEIVQGINGSTIINDAYNASPTSMKASIEVVANMHSFKNKIVILGDMYELGKESKQFHREVANVITNEIDVVFTLGNDAKEITEELHSRKLPTLAKHFYKKDDLLQELKGHLTEDTIVLLKASRGVKLETLLEDVQKCTK